MKFSYIADRRTKVKTFLKSHDVSKALLAKVKFMGENIWVNGVEQNAIYLLEVGDLVTIEIPNEEAFENLALKMERWFNVKIIIKSEKIKSYKLTGSFENETIDEALRELQYLVSFTYKKNGREIVVSGK